MSGCVWKDIPHLVFSRIRTLMFVPREFSLSKSLNIFLVHLCFILLRASLYLFGKWLTSGRTVGSSKARRGSVLITKSYSCASRGIAGIQHVFDVKVFTASCLNQWPVSFLRTILHNSDCTPKPEVIFPFNFLKGIWKITKNSSNESN